MLIYLASPYSKYSAGIEAAFRDVCSISGRMIKAGYKVYSPIAHTHPIAIYSGIDPLDHTVWLPFDAAIMDKCDHLMIAKMDGWSESYGIKEEMKIFSAAGKPIYYLDPITLEVSDSDGQCGII